jgi:hypothetical protein
MKRKVKRVNSDVKCLKRGPKSRISLEAKATERHSMFTAAMDTHFPPQVPSHSAVSSLKRWNTETKIEL